MKKIKSLAATILFALLAFPVFAQDHYPEYMQMARKAFDSGKYDLAIAYYESALDDKHDYWPAYQGIGTCFYLKGRKKEALKAFEKALKINPGNARLAAFVENLRRQLAASSN